MKELQLPSGNFLMFDSISHCYRIGTDWETGENVPGLHNVMEKNGLIEPMNEAMRPWVERGKRVHSAIEQYLEGSYDPDGEWAKSVEGPYLTAYMSFTKKNPEFANPIAFEALAGSEDSWMATMPDQIHSENRLLQVKTGRVNAKVHAVQTAFEGLLAFPSASSFERWAVYLDPVQYDGGFKLVKYDDDDSLTTAMAIFQTRKIVRKYLVTRRKPTKAVEKV